MTGLRTRLLPFPRSKLAQMIAASAPICIGVIDLGQRGPNQFRKFTLLATIRFPKADRAFGTVVSLPGFLELTRA